MNVSQVCTKLGRQYPKIAKMIKIIRRKIYGKQKVGKDTKNHRWRNGQSRL